MLIYNQNQTVEFSIFKKFPEILCVCSMRALGHLNVGIMPIENALKLLNLFQIPLSNFVSQRQRHGSNISLVHNHQGKQIIQDNDGLLTQDKNLFLGVKFADCVPVFYYDPVLKIAALAHSGWKGTKLRIAQKMVVEMKNLGSDPKNIHIGIGPHICGICYEIGEDVKDEFISLYPDKPDILFKVDNRWHLDLGKAIKYQLINAGIDKNKIDMPDVCTSCDSDKFFSYRKDKKDEHGEMLGIIGIRS